MQWWEIALTSLFTLLTGLIGGGWYSKKKAHADAESSELVNLKEIIVTWKESYSDLKLQREEFNKMSIDLQRENLEMRHEISELQRKVRELQCENNELKKEIEKLKQ